MRFSIQSTMDLFSGYASSDSDDEDSSEAASLDSAEMRAFQAEARLRDYGEQEIEQARTSLPSVLSAFDQVDGPPEFLDPEATRQLVVPVSFVGCSGLAAGGGEKGLPSAGGGGGKVAPGPGFDIAKLAPKIKGDKRPVDTREMPAGALIEGKAKRYKAEDGPEAVQAYSAMTIAMLGGKVAEGPIPGGGAAARGPSTKPMEVSEFLNKGVGGAALPRRAQDRKDKEKEKRAKGQSAIGSWKTEAEMVLRQQYDS